MEAAKSSELRNPTLACDSNEMLSALALAHQVGEKVAGVSSLFAFGSWVVEFTGRMLGSIPSLWLYGGLTVIAALYATFFGLGAVAYRAIYRPTN